MMGHGIEHILIMLPKDRIYVKPSLVCHVHICNYVMQETFFLHIICYEPNKLVS